MTNLIGIAGKASVGKDTVGTIVQYLTEFQPGDLESLDQYLDLKIMGHKYYIKKFADKLKDIACLLIGCSREDLEDQEFKEKPLGEEWWTTSYSKTGMVKPYAPKDSEVSAYKITKTTPRLLMQLIGSECGRDILHPNLWINSLFVDYNPIGYESIPAPEEFPLNVGSYDKIIYPSWIISDVRYENECKAIKDRGGILIRVNRPYKPEIGEIISMIYGGTAVVGDIVDNNKGYNEWVVLEKGTREIIRPWDIVHPSTHISETSLDDYQGFDYVLNNDSDIPALIEKVKEILKQENII